MKHIYKLILLFLFLGNCSFAQIATTFMRLATAPGMNGGLSLAETSDGGFVGAGQQQAGSAGGCDIYVYKVNSCGYLQWEKLFGGAGDDGGKYVQQTADGGYIVACLYNSVYDVMLLKLDASGNLQWSRVYTAGYGLFVQQTSDGGFILSGFSAAGAFGGNDVILIKTDANGNTQWIKNYGGAGNEWGNYVEQTSDGGYIVGGYTSSYGAGSTDLFLMKLNNAGTIQWSKTYGGAAGEGSSSWGISAQATSDGGYMVCGNTGSYGAGSNDILLVKTDNSGNLQWSKTYGGTADDQPRFAHQISNGGYIICGYTTSFGHGDLDAYLLKTDVSGNLLWSKAYGDAAYDKGEMVREAPDKGFALSMITLNFGADYYDPVFMKTDSMGVVGCHEANCATVVTNVSPAVGTGMQEVDPGITATNPPIAANNYSAADNFICLHCGIIPTFTQSSTTACIGNTINFYNTTSPGAACTQWFVNGLNQGVHDTLSLIFSSSGIQRVQLVASCGNSTDTNTVAINILAHDAPAATFSNTSVCNGSPTQFTDHSTSTSGTISGWSWNFGDGSSANTNISPAYVYTNPGVYTAILTVTTTFGCSDTAMRSITVHSVPHAQFDTVIVCRGDSIQFNDLSTITAPDVIQSRTWNFGDGSPINHTQNPLHGYVLPGTYTVSLLMVSNFGCRDSITHSLIVNPPIHATAGFGSSSLCTGGNITLGGSPTAAGGQAPYTYTWLPAAGLNNASAANPVATVSANTTYSVIVRDSKGCQSRDSVHLIYSAIGPHADAGFGHASLCSGGNILLGGAPTASGGTAPYTYAWLPVTGLNNASASNPTAVITANITYAVTIVDAAGCQNISTVSVTYNVPGPFADAGFGSNTLCTGGTVLLGGAPTGTGGTAPYTYNWLPAAGLNNATASNPAAVVTANTFYVVIVTDATGCQNLDSVHILFNASGPHAEAGFGLNTLCTGGTIILGGAPTAFGGTSPYTYSWHSSAGINDTSVSNPTASITSNSNYYVIVRDAGGCQDIDSVSLTYNASGPFADAGFGHNAICTGGTVLLGGNPTGSGGVSPYSYTWMPGAGLSSIAIANPTATIIANTFYVVVVTDAGGCQNLDSVHLLFNSNGPHAVAGFGSGTICTGGTALLGGTPTASGGTAPYTYSWVPGAGINITTASNPTASITSNSTYAVIVTDSLGCEDIDSVSLTFNASGPHAEAGFGNNTLCTGGTIILGGAPTSSGGTTPYTYSWFPSAGLNTTSAANPTATVTSNSAYYVIVRDGAGCEDIDSVALTYSSSGPFADAGFGQNTICTGGTALLGGNPSASGGASPYSYTWMPGAGLNNITASNPTASITANTFYVVVVTDAGGCQNLDSVHLLFNSNGPHAEAGFGSNTLCSGGLIILGGAPTSSGGTAPYTYSWQPGNNLNSQIIPNPIAAITADFAYYLIVTDAAGCEDIDSVAVTYHAGGPFADAGFGSNSICTGGTVLLGGTPTGTGGTSPYGYAWIPASGLNSTSISNPTASITANRTYTVTVTDATGCQNLDSVNLLFNSNGPYAHAGNGSNNLCTGGTLQLGGSPSALSGTSPYTYTWVPAAGLSNANAANPYAVVTANIIYSLIIIDAAGCEDIDSVAVTFNPAGPHADAGAGSGAHCKNQDFLLGGTPSGTSGTPPYTYSWIPAGGLNNTSIANPWALAVGVNTIYYLTVTDAAGCINIDSASVAMLGNGLTADFSASPVSGIDPLSVYFTNLSTGSSLTYQWLFDEGHTSTDINPSHIFYNTGDSAKGYVITLIATDIHGCIDTATLQTIRVDPETIIIYPNVFSPNGDGINDVFNFTLGNINFVSAGIFNRWGEKMYEWSTGGSGWDGRTMAGVPASPGTYFFILNMIDRHGNPLQKNGSLTLVR